MKTTARTAPALPDKAAAIETIRLPRSLTRFSGAGRKQRSTLERGHDRAEFGPISRAEMREIVLEMIG